MAIIARCRIPPLIWWGYSRARRSGSGMWTLRSHSTARSAASRFPHTLCAVNTSATCSPTVSTGFRDDIGSWKIIEIDFPRTPHILFSGRASRSSPRNRISPPSTTAGGDCRSRRTDSAVTVLPHPDSPTSPTVSAGATEKETPKRARTVPFSVPKESRSPRTSSSVSGTSLTGLSGAGPRRRGSPRPAGCTRAR